MAEQYSIVYMCHHSFLWLSNIPLHICTLSPFDCKEIQPVHPKGNQSWILIGRTDATVKALILWSPDVKNWLIREDPDAGKDRRQEEKWMTENETVGMASPTWWIWTWASSGSWWCTGRPGMVQSMGLQRVGHNWATELNWLMYHILFIHSSVNGHLGSNF